MAQSKKVTNMHAEQVAEAVQIFEIYKKFIAEEFIARFGGSYESPESLPCDWRDYYEYKPHCEEVLIDITKTFIHAYPSIERKHKSPVFLKNITSLISEYLSKYIAKKGWDRNACTKYLKEILFSKNRHVQLEINRYVKENNRVWGLRQKEKREKEAQDQQKRKRFYPGKAQPVETTAKDETKSVNARIKEKKKQLGISVKPVYSEQQEAKYKEQILECKARKSRERINSITIEVSINGIER